jgi:prepilin-type N-terminal cleavage/methylation domain-containing protein
MEGFSLIEIIIVMALVLILVAASFSAYPLFTKKTDLTSSVERIVDTLRLAHSNTLASEGGISYGVHFENDKFAVFKGTSYSVSDPNNILFDLDSDLEIYDIDLNGGGQDIIFNRLTGYTAQNGDINIRVIEDASSSFSVSINSSGSVNIKRSGALPPSGNRISDSRHTHFDLGWSIQNASALKFDFLNDGRIETVGMSSYFDAGKTEFDWSGSFDIGGEIQEFRAHTHSLDGFNTLLCVHRDRNAGKNTKEVKLYIVDSATDKDIVTYDDDQYSILYQGAYVNIMSAQ